MAYTLEELAALVHGELQGDRTSLITGASALDQATKDDVSFLSLPLAAPQKYIAAAECSKAGAIFAKKGSFSQEGRNIIFVEDPSRAFQTVMELFITQKPLTHFSGIHPTAIVHPTAKVHESVTLMPFVVVDGGATIGAHSVVGSFTFIGRDAVIGQHCMLYPNVTIREECVVHDRVVIQPGVVIGGCGFGFTTDATGKHTKLNQLGQVVIENDVEIGANTTIDRARFQVTKIGEGTKIDNLVQIAHGVIVGKHNLIVSQTGIAGSTKTGNHVILAGQVAVNGHISICDGVIITARSGVSKSITKPGKYGGAPCMPLDQYNRMMVAMRKFLTKDA